MNKAKLLRVLLFFAVIFAAMVLVSQFAFAIGLTPAKKIIDFAPNEKQQVAFKIVNNEKKDFDALVSLKGELAQYLDIKDILVKVNANEEFKEIIFDLELPQKILNPGVHEAEIIITELPKDIESQDDIPVVKASPSVVGKLWLRVPFPRKYAESKLIVEEAKVSENVKFTMPIFNYGQEKIERASATLKVYDGEKELAELKTNEISIDTKGQGVLSTSWKADVNPGRYKVVALIDYDGNIPKLEQEFSVGSLFVEITKVDIGKFSLGGIAKFDIYLDSKWNKFIDDVYGEMGIIDKNGTLISTIKTVSTELKPFSNSKITAFWDTKGISIGTYDSKLTVYYAGEKTEKSFSISVNIDSLTTNLLPTAQVVGKKGIDRENILILVVVVLILINVGWYVYFKKIKKRNV